MAYSFLANDIQTIATTLGAELSAQESSWFLRIATQQSAPIALSIHNNVGLDEQHSGSLITAQTQHGYFEIHDCSGFVVVEPDEVLFVSSSGEFLSSLVVGAQGTCSLFANIRKSIIHADFAKLDSTILMAAMQLSLTEQVVA